jgi:hypothetical protein
MMRLWFESSISGARASRPQRLRIGERRPQFRLLGTIGCAATGTVALLLIGLVQLGFAGEQGGVRLTRSDDRVRVEVNGQLLTEYYFTNVPKPFCYPLIGPGGAAMTRNFPMQPVPGEERDHPHHRSFWFAHGDVNGVDFWTEKTNCGKIVHAGFLQIKSGPETGIIRSTNNWVAADGKIICTDVRTMRFYHGTAETEHEASDVSASSRGEGKHGGDENPDAFRMFDFEITMFASHGELTFGDTKEGTMAVRLAETMRLNKQTPKGQKPIPGDGHIINSNGVRDADTWGKRADWCDYYGPVDGKTVGIAIFDDPRNPHHPTWWMARDYGLFGANPFGQHDYEPGASKTAGQIVVPAGSSITFRYRFYLHQGDVSQGGVARRYKEFVQ